MTFQNGQWEISVKPSKGFKYLADELEKIQYFSLGAECERSEYCTRHSKFLSQNMDELWILSPFGCL